MEKYLYFYYTIKPKDKQLREVTLVSKDQFKCSRLFLRDLEGIIITEIEIPFQDQNFPEINKQKIEEKYKGKFDSFENYK
jgi:hypothetical protein